MRATVEPKEQTAEPKPANSQKTLPVDKVATKPEVVAKTVPRPIVAKRPVAEAVQTLPVAETTKPVQKIVKDLPVKAIIHNQNDLSEVLEPKTAQGEIIELVDAEESIVLDAVAEYEPEELIADLLIDNEVLGEVAAEPPVILLAELPFLDFVPIEKAIAEDVDYVEIAEPSQTITEQIAEYIQTLESAKAEEAEAILGVMTEKIQLLLEHSELTEDDTSMDAEILEQELGVLCERLLVCIGIEPSSENVNRLMISLKAEIQQNLEAEAVVYDQGTHEKKHGFAHHLDELDGIIEPPSTLLGQYALQLASAS